MKAFLAVLLLTSCIITNVNAETSIQNLTNSNEVAGSKWRGKGQWRYWVIEFQNNGMFKLIDESPYKQHPITTKYSYDKRAKEGLISNFNIYSFTKSNSDNTSFSVSGMELYLWVGSKTIVLIFERM